MMAFSVAYMPGSSASKKEKIGMIYLVPIGKVEQVLVAYLSSQIEQIFPFQVKIGKTLPHPSYAYNEKRDQYQSDPILKELQSLDLQKAEKILGVVSLDLYTSGLNFVFGQALMGNNTALIALSRLRQEFYGLPCNKKLYYERAVKEAIHELGHTFGLHHCKNPKCVMHFSNSLSDTDFKGKEFCNNCQKKLPL